MHPPGHAEKVQGLDQCRYEVITSARPHQAVPCRRFHRRAGRKLGASVLGGRSGTMTTDRPAAAASETTLRVLRDVLRQVPGLDAGDLAASLLPGGLTNRNYCVDSAGRRVV